MARFALAGWVLLSLAGCAARGPAPELLAELGKAEALMREGCYSCLTDAQSIFERLSAPPRPVPGAARGAFHATLLIAMREKELGLPAAGASLDRARQHANRLAGTKYEKSKVPPPAAVSPAVLLAAAALVNGETGGLDPEQRARLFGARPALDPANAERRALDPWVDTDPVAQYVALMIDCEQTRLRQSVRPAEVLARYPGVPLIQFRVSVCGGAGAPQAGPLREANPRFLDTLPWEARRALVGSQTEAIDLYKGAELLGQAHKAFPASHWLAPAQ